MSWIPGALTFTLALLAGVGLGMLLVSRWRFAQERRRRRKRLSSGAWRRSQYQRGWADVGPKGLP